MEVRGVGTRLNALPSARGAFIFSASSAAVQTFNLIGDPN